MNPEEITKHIIEISNQITGLQADMKATWKRIDEQKSLADSVHTLALSVRDLTNTQEHMMKTIATMRRDVDELKAKPAKRWESLAGNLMSAIVGAVIMFVAARLGMK